MNLQGLDDAKISYQVKLSKKAKRMRIAVYSDSSVVLTLPWAFNRGLGESFIKQKLHWILKSLKKARPFKRRLHIKSNRQEYLKFKSQALVLAQQKVQYWNQIYNFKFNKIAIKNQKTRWGSCSRKGNLNFNFKIVHLTERVLDYLIVHELCHLKEFNHSNNFWMLVGREIPNYKVLRQQLRQSETVLS